MAPTSFFFIYCFFFCCWLPKEVWNIVFFYSFLFSYLLLLPYYFLSDIFFTWLIPRAVYYHDIFILINPFYTHFQRTQITFLSNFSLEVQCKYFLLFRCYIFFLFINSPRGLQQWYLTTSRRRAWRKPWWSSKIFPASVSLHTTMPLSAHPEPTLHLAHAPRHPPRLHRLMPFFTFLSSSPRIYPFTYAHLILSNLFFISNL